MVRSIKFESYLILKIEFHDRTGTNLSVLRERSRRRERPKSPSRDRTGLVSVLVPLLTQKYIFTN